MTASTMPSYIPVLARTVQAAAYGLHEYANSPDCEAPTYWRSIAEQLDKLR